ncbi:MAG: right-handed parallel beta-helix repeat-containing protein [Thermoguttaceae bacterium]|jgi:alpha-N-arabinofuranosidase|nr:right-handed parallel beta-helix repeat-containing protein [Thermoguttaceae bacterium]
MNASRARRLSALQASLAFLLIFPAIVSARELHVALNGSDTNAGTASSPLRTIQRAADLAQPGDVVTVHAGIYRERINPPRGGTSDTQRIVYQAAPGEKVEIKGSEIVKGWVKDRGDVWKVTLPNAMFGAFNPYSDVIRGDWFDPRGREHHTGAVYLDGVWLTEAAKLDDLFAPSDARSADPAGGAKAARPAGKRRPDDPANQPSWSTNLWYARVDASHTTIWAQFPGVDPNERCVEINVRRTVFYPDRPGRNYITLRGFTLRHAATPWAPPTAEQIGLVGTHWSKGWIIENNVVSHSICSGIALGKHGDQFDNTSANTAEGYVKTIERGLARGWNRETIGHHVVRNNVISHCEQAGIVGSLGAAFSVVTGNTIHDIHVRRLFSGAEMAGIKFHAAIDTVIQGNHIFRTCRGLWLDWMAQGTRVSRNLFHDNLGEDVFVEVNHGPFLADNNLFLSATSLLDMSEGGAYVHNLFAGRLVTSPEPNRQTPYHPAHSTALAGLAPTKGGDDRFYNNLFVGRGEAPGSARQKAANQRGWIAGYGLWMYDAREYPLATGGNVYYFGAQPYAKETDAVVEPATNPDVRLVGEGGQLRVEVTFGGELARARTSLVTTSRLGKAKVAGVAYENADGSPITVATDYFGKPRGERPTPGPFENPGAGRLVLTVK